MDRPTLLDAVAGLKVTGATACKVAETKSTVMREEELQRRRDE